MLRQLLTLLAIFTGLAALGTPAEARIAAFDGVQMESARERSGGCEVRQLGSPVAPLDVGVGEREQASVCPRPVVTVVIPTVQLGPDRARE